MGLRFFGLVFWFGWHTRKSKEVSNFFALSLCPTQRFSDKSRERQRLFMMFSALLCAKKLSIESWTSAIVDQIVFEGDKCI